MPTTDQWFVIATAGKTVDGREITDEQVTQAAESYDPDVYGARIWLEHIRALVPHQEGYFNAYGDVLELRQAQNKKGEATLEARINPTPELIELNRRRQKVYTSCELDTNFQSSGTTYLTGLGITDTPASTGTSMLLLNQADDTKTKLYTTYTELNMPDTTDDKTSILDAVKNLFTASQQQSEAAEQEQRKSVAELEEALLFTAEQQKATATAHDELTEQFNDLKAAHEQLVEKFDALSQDLESQPRHTPRPDATGGDQSATTETDC